MESYILEIRKIASLLELMMFISGNLAAEWDQSLIRWEADCESGVSSGCNIAGKMYEDGTNVVWNGEFNEEHTMKKNYERALILYAKGCAAGDSFSCRNHNKLSSKTSVKKSSINKAIESSAGRIPPIRNKKIYNAISKQLYNYGDTSAYGLGHIRGARIVHKLIGFYDIPSSGTKQKLIIASSNTDHGNDCHACAPKISFFIFRLLYDQWVLDKSYINVHSMGQWGDAPDYDGYQVVKLGDDIEDIGLFLKSGGGGQGIFEEYISLYAFRENTVEMIFHEQAAVGDRGTGRVSQDSWKAKFRFKRGNSNYYDIVLHKKGMQNGKYIDNETVYVYENSKYVKSKILRNTNLAEQRKRFVSVLLRDNYRATVTLDNDSFKFELAGYGDTLNLGFTKTKLTSDHIYGPMTECKREGDVRLVNCTDAVSTSDNAHGTLHYSYDGSYYDVVVEFADYRPSYKDHFYNDKKYMYWISYKNGKISSKEKFKIDRVY